MSNAAARVETDDTFSSLPPGDISIPERPAALDVLLEGGAEGAGRISALLELRDGLYRIPSDAKLSAALWREVVAASAFAGELARELEAHTPLVPAAAILHRGGHACALRAVGRSLRGSTRIGLASRFERPFAERLSAAWGLAPDLVEALLGWHGQGDLATRSTAARIVYASHLLAVELLQPDLVTPGIVHSAASALGLAQAAVEAARQQQGVVRSALEALSG
jgi:hypothetical protein